MMKLLKAIGILVGVVVLLLIAAVVVIPMYFDPNDHKDQIAAAVKENTGRDLRIEGQIGLTVFPWLGIDMGVVELGNAPGFEGMFARTEKVNVRVKLMPLLQKKVEMDTVTVHGLALNLARDANGHANWDDLGKDRAKPAGSTASTTGASGQGPAVAALAVGGLDIRNASLTWDDALAGQRFELTNLSAQTGALSPGKPVDLEVQFDLSATNPSMSGRVGVDGTVETSADHQRIKIGGLALVADLSGDPFPGGKLKASVGGDVHVDLAGQTLSVQNLLLAVLDLKASGALDVKQFQTAPSFSGRLTLAEFDPKALLQALGQPPIPTADPKAITKAAVSAGVSGGTDRLSLEQLSVTIDDTKLTGTAAVANFAAPAVRFDLAVDQIDADRYLPPGKQGETTAASPGAAAAGAGRVPLETLRALDVDGQFTLGKLKVMKANLSDIKLVVKAKDGVIRVNPATASLYDGGYTGNISLDARGDALKVAVDEKLAGVQVGPLLEDMYGDDRLNGATNAEVKVTATGVDPAGFKKTLNGNAAFAFTDGAINGVNVARMIREAKAKLTGGSLAPDQSELKTDFSELSGTVQLKNGIATNNDLSMKSPLLRIEGQGVADIPKETVDYRVKTTVVATTQGQGGEGLQDLAGITIPLKVTGTFQDPKYGLDFEAFAKAIATSKAADLVKGGAGAVTEAVKGGAEGAGGVVEGVTGGAGEAAKKATDALKGLLGN